jgi:hypothetical protein
LQYGSFIGCSGFIEPRIVFEWFARDTKGSISILKGAKNVKFWISNIISLKIETFVKICESIKDNIFLGKDSNDDKMPWENIKATEQRLNTYSSIPQRLGWFTTA